MPIIKAQVVLHTASNMPEDFASNTFHFDGTLTQGSYDSIRTRLVAFYTSLQTRFSSVWAQNGHEIKYYNALSAPPNLPLFTTTFNLGTQPTQTVLPTEVALCASFRSLQPAGIDPRRARGRIYLPWIASGVNGADGRPVIGIQNDLAAACVALDAAVDPRWVVWSVTDQEGYPIDAGHVDNEWDTQRRRGRKATSRVNWSRVV